jgi:hypothetical protein
LSRSLGKLIGLKVRIDRWLPNELSGEVNDLVGPLVDRGDDARERRSWYRLHDCRPPRYSFHMPYRAKDGRRAQPGAT